jgi:hypothetical protein
LSTSATDDQSELGRIRKKNRELEASVADLKAQLAIRSRPLAPEIPVLPEIVAQDPTYIGENGVAQSTVDPCSFPTKDRPVDLSSAHELGTTGTVEEIDTTYLSSDSYSTLAISKPVSPRLLNNAYTIPTSFIKQPSSQYWDIPVLLLPPENPVSGRLISILHQKRMENLADVHKRKFIIKPKFRSLLVPNSKPDDSTSTALLEMMASVGMVRIPEIVGSTWVVSKLMQWQTWPCFETYKGLPHWLVPRATQLLIPHTHWATMLPFPELRDRVIERQDVYSNTLFLTTFVQSLRVNWPFRDSDVFTFENGTFAMSKAFEKHVADMNNWTVTAPFTTSYPELQSATRFAA